MTGRRFTITLDITENTMRRFVDLCRPIAARLEDTAPQLASVVERQPDALTTGVMLLALMEGLDVLEAQDDLAAIWCEMTGKKEGRPP